MLASIRSLPVDSPETFLADPRTAAAAESYLRRALEALLDLGRHLLAKGHGRGVGEYKAIARALREEGVLDVDQARTLTELAGYRNRMVHFYHAVSDEELREICTAGLPGIEHILDALLDWLRREPGRVDTDI